MADVFRSKKGPTAAASLTASRGRPLTPAQRIGKACLFLGIASLLLGLFQTSKTLERVHWFDRTARRVPGVDVVTPASKKFAWEQVKPTEQLEYRSCFVGLRCARLEVPLDWNRTDGKGSKAAIAIAKLPARVPVTDSRYGGAVLINPGGPGGSGVMLLMREGKLIQSIIDANVSGPSDHPSFSSESAKYFDIIGFDPRGVNNTTPTLSCFPDAFSREAWALQAEAEGVLGSSDNSFALQWARSKALFQGCSQVNTMGEGAENEISQFMNTSPVARDMVEIVERHAEWREKEAIATLQARTNRSRCKRSSQLSAEERDLVLERTRWRKGEEKLLYWGFSYGTILGATFAAMFPNRVGRAVIDGVADSVDYYRGGWLTNLVDTDAILDQFCNYCHEAGPDRCALYIGDSPDDIKVHFDSIISSMKGNPLAVEASATRGPAIITYSEVRKMIMDALFKPVERFESMARMMSDVSKGNGSFLAELKEQKLWHASCASAKPDGYKGLLPEQCRIRQDSRPEVNTGILCADGESIVGMRPELYEEYWKTLQGQSQYLGDFWAEVRLPCIGWESRPKWRYSGPIAGNTSHPLLFIGNTYDPVTPLRNAIATAERFPGSVALHQDSEGHCSLAAPSICTAKTVRVYFQTGELPRPGTVCDADEKPLLGIQKSSVLSSEDKDLLEILRRAMFSFPS